MNFANHCRKLRGSRHAAARRGSAILQFAITLPILTLLLVGVLDWGLILFMDQHMVQAAREGARVRAAEGPSYNNSRAATVTQAYLTNVYPSLASKFTVTASPNGGNSAWVQVDIPLADASLTHGLLVLPGGNLTMRVELDYLTGTTP